MSSDRVPVKGSEAKPAPDTSSVPVEVFQTLERRDEQQILEEMRGEIISDLVYSTNIAGRLVTNLSYAGVKEAVRRRGNVEILDVRVEETDHELRALVKVRDHQNRIDVLGASSAEKSQPFAYTLAVNKAERNAFAKLIPAKWLATLVREYLDRKKPRGQHETIVSEEALTEETPKETLSTTEPSQSKPPLALDFEKLEWKLYRPPHRAGWVFADKAPRTLVEALEKGPVELGDFRYRFSGPEEQPKLFVTRSPLKD